MRSCGDCEKLPTAAASIFAANGAALRYAKLAHEHSVELPMGWDVDWQWLWPVTIQESHNLVFCFVAQRNDCPAILAFRLKSLGKVTFCHGLTRFL